MERALNAKPKYPRFSDIDVIEAIPFGFLGAASFADVRRALPAMYEDDLAIARM